jgi:hypothetical protein
MYSAKTMAFIKKVLPWLVFCIITLVGFSLRFYHLAVNPCGLFPDQALSGLEVVKGRILPYYMAFGEHDEGLFITLLGLVSRLIGLGVQPIFITTALIGSFTVPLAMITIRRFHGWLMAILTGALLATSPWHIALSRNGLRAILVPLFLVLIGWLALRWSVARRTTAALWASCFGLAVGLGFYTYSSYRAILGILPIIALIVIWRRQNLRLTLPLVLLGLLTALIPLGLFFSHHPEEIFARADQISVFRSHDAVKSGGLVLENLKGIGLSLAGFGGDTSWRNNLANEPLLPIGLAVFLAVGILVALTEIPQGKIWPIVYLGAFLCFWLPGIFAYDTPPPHDMRLVGELPLIYLLVAIGIVTTWKKLFGHGRLQPLLLPTLGVLSIILTYQSLKDLQTAETSPSLASDYRCDLTETADALRNDTTYQMVQSQGNIVYVVATTFDRFSLDYLLLRDPFWGFGQTPNTEINRQNLPYLQTKIRNLSPETLPFSTISMGDLILVPVYGELGFYHLDSPLSAGQYPLPWGGQNFLKQLASSYPDLQVRAIHRSNNASRYPQGISFIILARGG